MLDVAAVVSSVLLGALFVLAGAAKVALGTARWAEQARAMGVPQALMPLASATPWAEITTGAALVARLAMPWPAVVAAAMLVVFSWLLIARLRAGDRPPCACFGSWGSQRIGPGHLLRNAAMLALAALAIAGG